MVEIIRIFLKLSKMWELDYKESWTTKKAESWRIDASELQCWRRLLRIPWTARSSNQSILKEINPEYSLEGLKLKLKLQYCGHLTWRTDSLEKTLMLGKIEGRTQRTWVKQALGDSKGQGSLLCCSSWGRKESDWATKHHHKVSIALLTPNDGNEWREA